MFITIYYSRIERIEVQDKIFETLRDAHAEGKSCSEAEYNEACARISEITGKPLVIEEDDTPGKECITAIYDDYSVIPILEF